MDPVIRFEKLTKTYGSHRGVIDLDLTVNRGEVFGYLGPNGAGKTTTIRMLLDLMRPTSGAAMILGMDTQAQSSEVRRRIGYVPSDPVLYLNLSGKEFLTYAGNLRGGVDWRLIDKLADRLESDLSRRIGTLSHGNKQKIVIIQALMHQPELLILDEPTSGLDPLMQDQFERIIGEVKAEGRTIFLSSHILPDVEDLCDRVGIIREGRIVAVEDVSALKSMKLRSIEIEFGGPVRPKDFAGLEGVRDLTVEGNSLRCDISGSLDSLIKTAAMYEVLSLTTRDPSLEEIFLTYYGRGENNHAA